MTSPPSDPVPSDPPGRPPDEGEVSPWKETVRLSPLLPGPRGGSEPAVPDEALAAPPTSRFGKFIRTVRLGAGGMGEVWKAWDSTLGRWVALKFLKGGDDEEIARFRREAQTSGRLHHPNIAAIYEVNEDQGRHYIAMQYVDGKNLHQFPRADRALLVRLVADAARALQYAHEQGVIHRDLKPENLMVTVRGQEHQVFLMDFGLARAAEGASKISATGFLVGTPMYMSPEQARGEKVDVRSDVYSLGLTLYELLTDRKPFESESVYETLRRVQELDPMPLRQIDRKIAEDLETIVMKAISKDAAFRYDGARGLADDLQAYLAGDPIQGRRESLSRKLVRRLRRHPFALATAAVLVVGLATSGFIARGASRDRRVTELTSKLDVSLRAPEWTEEQLCAVEGMIAALAKADPAQASERRTRLPKALADSIRAADLARARQQLALLDRLDPAEAARIGAELRQRESIWPLVFKLEAPFAESREVFEPGQVRVAGESLRSAAAGLVRTRKTCEGNVELKAEFDGAWKDSSHLGLLFNPGHPSGYQFLLISSEAAPAPSFSAIREAKGFFRLQIRRGEVLIREELVDSGAIDTAAPLRLIAKREGDLLKLQVNDAKRVEFRDPFALGTGRKGVFAVAWPEGAGIRRLLATHQELPLNPSRLDVGDDLFLRGKFEEALDRYGEAGQSPDARAVRPEALYKQGLCNLQLNREEEARKIFEGIAAGFMTAEREEDKRWFFLADCQLLLLYFREKDGIDRAAAVLDKLPAYSYSFDTLALLLPTDIRQQILGSVQTGSVGGNFHLRPEDHLLRTELAVRASELLQPSTRRGEYEYHSLMRAYMMVGRNVEALRIAEKSFRVFRYGGEVLDDYSWILRLPGGNRDLQNALKALDPGLAADPTHYVERARIHAACKDWDAALKDVETSLAKPLDYQSFSAGCLIRGFILEQRGAPAEKVEEAWRRGLIRNWMPPKDDRGDDTYGPIRSGMSILYNWIMASLLNDMTDAEAERLLGGLMAFAGKDNPVFNKLMRPSMLRATWRTPRARDVARHVAFRDLSFFDIARYPLFVGWIEFVHEVCFNASEPLSPDQDELLWRMSGEIFSAYREGSLTDRYLLPFGVIVSGSPNAPGMGWREVSTLLEKNPKLRGPLAYVFGQRYVKKGQRDVALIFFKSASADADREPAQPLLKRLSQTELDALVPK
jgi:tetratricopeptide (TPR) repeat protein